EVVAVLAALLVPQADDVAGLVDGVAGRAAVAEGDELLPALAPDLRRAAAARAVRDEVGELRGVRRRALDELVIRLGLPVRDRVGDAVLVRQRRVDRERDRAVLPAELRAGRADGHARRHRTAGNGAEILRLRRDLLRRAENDVAFEHGQAVDDGVLHRLDAGAPLDQGCLDVGTGAKFSAGLTR